MYFLVDKGFMKSDEIDVIEEEILSRWNEIPAVNPANVCRVLRMEKQLIV